MNSNGTQRAGLYAWIVVAILSLASIVSYIDRQIINLLVEPIKADLGISDTAISLLQGFSFALFYAILAIPLARLSDSGNRRNVIIGGIACWGIATFSCGLATGFAVLFFARMFVGVGEATLAPAGYSMLSDYFPKEKLGLAISVFTGSGFIGSGIALIIGGVAIGYLNQIGPQQILWFGDLQPWQLAFILASLPCLLLVVLMLFVKEPVRQLGHMKSPESEEPVAFSSVVLFLLKNVRLYGGLFLGLTFLAAAGYSLGSWTPSYFIRVFEWSPEKTGTIFGTTTVISSFGGVIFGGWIANILAHRGFRSANLLVSIAAGAMAVPFSLMFGLMPSADFALAALVPALFFGAMPFGVGTAILPIVSPNRIRAQVVAIYLLIANILAYSLGPTSVALITDLVFSDPARVGTSLSIMLPILQILGASLLLSTLAPFRNVLDQGLELEAMSPLTE